MLPAQESDDTTARLFLAVAVPPSAYDLLQQATNQYSNFIDKPVPPEKWHVTLLYLGDDVVNHTQYISRLSKSMSQTYVPTLTLTHVGRGIKRDQLWAYAHITPMLQQLREALVKRLQSMRFPLPPHQMNRDYAPHIHLANLYDMSRGFGLADYPTPLTFAVREVILYRSWLEPQGSRYEVESRITLAT